MQPADSFWDGTGQAIANSPGWMVTFAVATVFVVLGCYLIYARFVRPSRDRLKMRELDIKEHEASNDAERIKANAMLAEQQAQTNGLIDGMRRSLDASTAHTDVLVAELRASRERSKDMGEAVSRIDVVTARAAEQVEDIHRAIVRRGDEG